MKVAIMKCRLYSHLHAYINEAYSVPGLIKGGFDFYGTHKLVHTCNRGPPIVPLLFIPLTYLQ